MQRVDDPKISVTLTVRRSTVEKIKRSVPEGVSVNQALSQAVESKYGR